MAITSVICLQTKWIILLKFVIFRIEHENNNSENKSCIINIEVGDQSITATMEDNVVARNFLSCLELEITLNDYANTEKIFYPSPDLNINSASRSCKPDPGNITIYAPWRMS